MEELRLVIADEVPLVRAGLCAILKEIEGVEVVAAVGDSNELLESIREAAPDLVVLDAGMPGLNGTEITRGILQEFPTTRILMLSLVDNEGLVLQALRAGALGFMLKAGQPEEFETAIRAVARQDIYLSPVISNRFIMGYVQHAWIRNATSQELTPRQIEILRMIAEGTSTRAMATALKISYKTVETHRALLMERLGIGDVAGLVRYAIRNGVIEL